MKIFEQKILKKIFSQLLAAMLFFAPIFYAKNSHADVDYGVGRTRTCSANSSGDVIMEGLEFNPTMGGKDIQFVLSNPVCLTVIATSYAVTKVAIAEMNARCQSGSSVPRLAPSVIMDFTDIAYASRRAISDSSCAASLGVATAAFTSSLAEIAIIYGVAKPVYDNAKICGRNWIKADPANYNIGIPDYKQTVQRTIEGYIRDDQSKLSLGDKTYREWYYGGIEVEDDPDGEDPCLDPTQPKVISPLFPLLAPQYPRQKYYMKGTEAGNFNCKKYQIALGQNDPLNGNALSNERKIELEEAYACCKKRSQEYICIEYDPIGAISSSRKFCKAGSLCTLQGITFSTKSVDNGRLICAETYSLCPYNFALSGGSEYCDYYRDGKWNSSDGRWDMITPVDIENGDCATKSEIRNSDCTYNEKAGKCQNYCQYLTHCTKTSGTDFIYRSSLSSPYFSVACLNFIGDSQNRNSYGSGFLLGSQRHFGAPIAQCVKETLENVFYNRAGHSKCLNYNEIPNAEGTCNSGQYATEDGFVRREGNQVQAVSFFSIVQDTLQETVKMVLTLAIMFYGIKLLFGMSAVTKKDLLLFILKIGVVMYFATGDAWQSFFFKGVYGASAEFSRIVFKIEIEQSENRRDGCQFGEVTTPDGITLPTGSSYPAGKEYLAIWDTLDCKIARYLGFGPEDSAANIASLIAAAFFTGAVGIYFAISVMFFGFFFIAATIRALHIFLSSALSIIIFVFVSPIVIPTMLFAKTADIFKKWATNLLSFCLQPMILFAYISIFIIAMDRSLIGSATFVGTSPGKTISCSEICRDSNGNIVPYVNDQAPACDQQGQVLINPMDDSVACLINVKNFGKAPGFELLGISIPILKNLFDSNAKLRVLTMLKGALVMYLLCKFMDEIPGITSKLIGGGALPGSTQGSMEMLKGFGGTLAAIQKRAARGGKKLGKEALGKGKEGVREAGDQGKAVKEDNNASDSTGRSGGPSDSSAKSGGDSADSSGKSQDKKS